MRSGKPTQVKVRAASAAEHERWRLEAKRRKWSLNTLIREAVNKEIGAWVDQQPEQRKAVG